MKRIDRVDFRFTNLANYRLRLLPDCGVTWHTHRRRGFGPVPTLHVVERVTKGGVMRNRVCIAVVSSAFLALGSVATSSSALGAPSGSGLSTAAASEPRAVLQPRIPLSLTLRESPKKSCSLEATLSWSGATDPHTWEIYFRKGVSGTAVGKKSGKAKESGRVTTKYKLTPTPGTTNEWYAVGSVSYGPPGWGSTTTTYPPLALACQ